jgi:hypothetical protein
LRSRRVAIRRFAFSQALVRSTGQRWRACGSRVFSRRFFAAPHLAHRRAGGDRFSGPARLADPRLDLAFAQRLLERLRGVAAVGPQLGRLDAARGERVEQRQQVPSLVLVAGREPHRQRRPWASTARW